ncbi:MAG TPA: DUF3310 domain-containing protein [Methylomirabilota bacterium]|nr:DUF3310 domain-containing protein [Methylomirabilota bacterium]
MMVSNKCGQEPWHLRSPGEVKYTTSKDRAHSEPWHNTTPQVEIYHCPNCGNPTPAMHRIECPQTGRVMPPMPQEVGLVPPNCDYPFDFDEGKYLDELYDYIGKTYTQHYAKGIQVTKFIMSHMNSPDFLRGNVLKYTTRYGRKEGYNRNDILKAIHYAILMLYYHDSIFYNKKGLSDND